MKFRHLLFALIVAAGLFLNADSVYDTSSGFVRIKQRAARPEKPSEVRYVCPMHPEVVSKTPGACRKCNMTLVKKSIVKTS